MSKAEKFIQENTKTCTNQIINGEYGTIFPHFNKWLTPDDARKAVGIAKEEIIDKTLDFLKDKLYESGYIGIMDLCDDYIKAMKDET